MHRSLYKILILFTNLVVRDRSSDHITLIAAQSNLACDVGQEVLDLGGARDCDDIVALGGHPREAELRRRYLLS